MPHYMSYRLCKYPFFCWQQQRESSINKPLGPKEITFSKHWSALLNCCADYKQNLTCSWKSSWRPPGSSCFEWQNARGQNWDPDHLTSNLSSDLKPRSLSLSNLCFCITMTTWLLIFKKVCNQFYRTVTNSAYSETKSAPHMMTIIVNIIAAATLTEQLLCYCSKGLTPINSITKTLNAKITYTYRFLLSIQPFLRLWRRAI